MAAGAISVTFHVECTKTKPGDAVFIVGSAPELGAWKPGGAVPCITSRHVFPMWTSEMVKLPAHSERVEFKVIVMPGNGKHPDKATWEGGSNRFLHLPKNAGGGGAQLAASCAWGEPEVTYRTKLIGGASPGGGQGKRPSAEKLGATGGALASPSKAKAGVDFHVDETGDGIGELKPLASMTMTRMASRNSALLGSSGSMIKRGSRHMCISSDGLLNAEMSRTPSLMLVDADELAEEVAARSEEMEELERQKLNQMQRRMPSGSLLESMRGIIDTADKNNTVMLQGFNWESWRAGGGDWYSIVQTKIQTMSDMGITDVWLPPPSQSVAPQGYLPSQLFNIDGSKYGNQAALEGLVKAMHESGIRAVADIVVNHRCGDKQDSQGRWNQFTSGMESRPSFAGVMDWGGWAITLGDKFSDGTGQNHPGQFDGKFDAAPDIDHQNKQVQASISIWLRWLQLQIGFDAWRFDFVKGYAAEFVGLYCKKSAPAWAVGELWGDMQYDDSGLQHNQDRHRQDLVNWVNATDKQSTAFDFTTKGVLQEAVKNCQYWRLKDSSGKPPGLIGWMPKHAVTFIDNHDTGSTQRHWPFPDDKVLVGYAYIITHPGIPSLFWDHVFDWGEHHRNQIKALLRARRESGIPVDAPVKIQCADHDLYLAEIGSPPALRVALGPRHAGEPDRNYWSNGPAGNQFRVWVHKKEEKKEEKSKAVPSPPPAAAPSPKAQVAVSFTPITVDGQQLTPENIKGMNKNDLGKVCAKLEPVIQAAKDVMASK